MRTKQHIVLGILLLSLSGCGNFLEQYSQDTDYVKSWKDLDELLVGSCYTQVKASEQFSQSSDINNIGTFLHLVTDEMQETTANVLSPTLDQHESTFGFFTWQQRTGQNESYSSFFKENRDWTEIYKYINVANNVLESVHDVPQHTKEEQAGALKVSGEAHFLRGFYYFWLVNVYGHPYDPTTANDTPGVPLKTSSEVVDMKFQRNSIQEVYNQVLADLLSAESELTQITTPKKSIYRADSTAVLLLLSRVYLYMQQWNKAAEYARRVVARHPRVQDLNADGSSFMLSTNPENIFSMGGDDVPTMLQQGAKGLKVSDQLYTAYSNNDYRKTRWFWNYGAFHGLVKRYPDSSNETVSPAKQIYYYQTYTTGLRGSQSPISSVFWLRSAEAYLNLAEAEAYMGHEDNARSALLTLMANRYHPASPELDLSTVSGERLIALIREERRKEFVLEGQRWFDLRRYRVCTVFPQKQTITHDYTYYVDRTSAIPTETRRYVLTEEDASWTLPMPTEVLEFNTGMLNNGNQWRSYTTINN